MPSNVAVTAILREEHGLIRTNVQVLRNIAAAVRAGQPFPGDDLVGVAGFLREFAEHQHHRKEESLLLVTLAAHGADDAAEGVGELLRDHEETRELAYMLTLFWEPAQDVTTAERAAFARVALTYCERIERHMAHEESCFFPLAERTIPGDDKIDLLREFAAIDAGRPSRAEWLERVAGLQARWPCGKS